MDVFASADQATMEAHAALVGGENLQRMGPIVTVAIKDDVEQAGADDEAKDHADDDARQIIDRDVKTPTALRTVHNDRREQGTDHVGQAIPVNGDGARRNRDGIKHMVEVVEHVDPCSLHTNAAAGLALAAANLGVTSMRNT